jgi:hypothetical protein
MNALARTVSAWLLSLVVLPAGWLGPAVTPQRQDNVPPMPVSNVVHGTIVVVVSTKDGFVLAGDSRGSRGCTAAPGEFEKVFSFGERSAIVVAGMIESYDSSGEMGEAVATDLHALDRFIPASVAQPQATRTMRIFVDAIRRQMSLLDPSDSGILKAVGEGRPVAGASAVSIDEKGVAEWTTLTLAPVIYTGLGGSALLNVKLDRFVDPPLSKVQSLGSGSSIVEQLVGLENASADDSYSLEPIMNRYYSLKRTNRLSDLTLEDGKGLARLFVEAAINYAATRPCLGIGGSIDVLTVTSKGTEWVSKKTDIAAMVPLYHGRLIDSDMVGPLDGVEWLRGTVPANGTLTFDGYGDVKVAQPRFAGPCTLIIGPDAERRMPATTERLKAIFGGACDVQSVSGEVNAFRSAAQLESVPDKPAYERAYACIPDARLKKTVLGFVAQFKSHSNPSLRMTNNNGFRSDPPCGSFR